MADSAGDGPDWGCVIPLLLAVGFGAYFYGKSDAEVPVSEAAPLLSEPTKADDKPPPEPENVPTPEPPASPATQAATHNYNYVEDRTYGYFSQVSDEDRKKGRAVGDVMLYRYTGSRQGKYYLTSVNEQGQHYAWSECANPCKAIRHYSGGQTQMIPYSPGSVIGSAFEDAINGRLKKWTPPPPPKPISPPVEEPVETENTTVTLPESPAT